MAGYSQYFSLRHRRLTCHISKAMRGAISANYGLYMERENIEVVVVRIGGVFLIFDLNHHY